MQQPIFQHATITDIETRIGRVLPGHGTGVGERAANSDIYLDESGHDEPGPEEYSRLQMVFSVLGNVIGGSFLIYGLIALPHLITKIFS
jgi:hypothetical protein